MEKRYTGVIEICDWEHNGDYEEAENVLYSISGVTITSYRNEGDGRSAYIYFECEKDAIIPLTKSKDLDSLYLDYPYENLLPKNFSGRLKLLKNFRDFVPVKLEDHINTPLSWGVQIDIKDYIRNFQDRKHLMNTLSKINMKPESICLNEKCIYLYGVSTLAKQLTTITSVHPGQSGLHIFYYFRDKVYSLHEFHYFEGSIKQAIKENFSELIYKAGSSSNIKDKFTTKTQQNAERIKKEIEKLSDDFEYFNSRKKGLDYYGVDCTETSEKKLVIKTINPEEGIKFCGLHSPYVVKELRADNTRIELIDSDGSSHVYLIGSSAKVPDVFIIGGNPVETQHDLCMDILDGIEITYFFD